MKELEKLSKKQLIEVAKSLIYWQEEKYKSVKGKQMEPVDAFWQLAGNFQSVREGAGLPKLYID